MDDDTIRIINKEAVSTNSECQQILKELRTIERFLSDFSFLTLGRDFISCRKWSFSIQRIITSLELTMGSIISCCESACLADANSLLRKYRDDMFFYLYIAVFDANKKLGYSLKDTDDMESAIIKWIENGLSDFNINFVLKAIGSAPQLEEAVKKYNLQVSFSQIGERLNNYMHSNGYAYYNRNVNAYKPDELNSELKKLLEDTKYITIAFLFLLILCSPLSVMSTDYCDSLDCDITPQSDSQYWVAPFIEQFVNDNIVVIDMNCFGFLKENTLMQF